MNYDENKANNVKPRRCKGAAHEDQINGDEPRLPVVGEMQERDSAEGLKECHSFQFSDYDKRLLIALYGTITMGEIEFKNLKPSQRSLYIQNREECMLM